MMSRFSRTFIVVIVALFLVGSIAFLHPRSRSYFDPRTGDLFDDGGVEQEFHILPVGDVEVNAHLVEGSVPGGGVHGKVVMPKLGNATAKAELGRATWKLLHTMTLRYPEAPTDDEREALNSYFHLMSRLYPCGECAAEFQELLKKYPPQTSSRRSASLWLCSVHNRVNERLGKPRFDCAHLDATYDCGCGDDPIGNTTDVAKLEGDRDKVTGAGLIKGGR
ncbi:ERV/ALR sulfhydryl oxidase domain-containing protein [Vararia minispora EC-137]|uniref:ERV/ALR sulfhydryl oxidase domain-containing protein n=1 Tax=Vararia minispora EC-137 TaxID=1314806 RepID=A0ACB8QB52_9AGAM|nr:ERV/ALR sulfhydryl oxidase domain-containing protein [Vararia minispora EC-137]